MNVYICVVCCQLLLLHLQAAETGLLVAWFHSLNFWSEEIKLACSSLWTLFLQYRRVKRYSETLSAALSFSQLLSVALKLPRS